MRRTEDCVRRLVTELADARTQLLRGKSRFAQALSSLDDLAGSIRSSPGAARLARTLVDIRTQIDRLQSDFVGWWAERLRRLADMADELRLELSRDDGLADAPLPRGLVVALQPGHEDADHKSGVSGVPGRIAGAVSGNHQSIPATGGTLALQDPVHDDPGGVQIGPASRRPVGRIEVDEMPAAVPAVAD